MQQPSTWSEAKNIGRREGKRKRKEQRKRRNKRIRNSDGDNNTHANTYIHAEMVISHYVADCNNPARDQREKKKEEETEK